MIFSCLKNVFLGGEMPCPSIKVNTVYRKDEKSTNGTKDWETCSKLCKKREGCRFWTWYHENDPNNALQCVTMTEGVASDTSHFAVSGDYKCGGRYCRFKD